ncbi:putative permease [Salinarchaeum sp. Harcht-Bsk1]|uniref:TSUP family transporter n=1 Tax=Salinarchaeum sp. Harcht-Bsk1 TaxID=1333523 RepID=UPI0003423B73|nr:TSUP family transporter [Salinarchaeum sp. Harcht-Bsk1]AGN00037.1 putative permease [Salinarchaeum sp. Harcht-Bsk1]
MPDAGSSPDIPTPPGGIGEEAAVLDANRTTVQRLSLPRSARRIVLVLGLGYALSLLVFVVGFGGRAGGTVVVPSVVIVAFVLESTDSATGMGFGTGLAPLLFVFGYEPLAVVPALLLSESVTGLLSGLLHHEMNNVTFRLRPPNREIRLVVLLILLSTVALVISVTLVHALAILPQGFVEAYVSVLVVLMGAFGLLRTRIGTPEVFRPRRLVGFALFAGASKGIGGGGFGPVVTLGQILSGVYEKSAVAITSASEGVLSLVGGLTFLVFWYLGEPVDFLLVPSVLTGGFFAAILAPYLVRVVPNSVWQYLIPGYAVVIGVAGVVLGLGV